MSAEPLAATSATGAAGAAGGDLVVRGLTKRYGSFLALDGVDLNVRAGTVQAIAGQNGAGKSTLIKMLSGVEAPSSGSITLGGTPFVADSPQHAQAAGIQTIHQELSLVPELSVAENIFLGAHPRSAPRTVAWGEMRTRASAALARVGFDLDVRTAVTRLSVAEQQAVELAKALHREARVLLLDEPTSTLPPPDVERLFRVLRSLLADGVTMLYISHRMDEVFELCQEVTVLRDGRRVDTFPTATTPTRDVVSAMVGATLRGSLAEGALAGQGTARLGTGRREKVLLQVRSLSDGLRGVGGKVSDISFDVHEGEVVGLAGLVGSGQSELAGAIAGARPRNTGSVLVDGHELTAGSPRTAIKHGLGFLPQDRKSEGFVPEMSVTANMTLASLPQFSRLSVRNGRAETAAAQAMARRLRMRIAGVNQPMQTLSGGTQQKAILARWLVRSARVLVCDEPTRGVDVGAKEEIYELLRDFARDGGTVLLASSELTESLMCDRILVMARGRLVADLDRSDVDPAGQAVVAHFA